MPRLDFWLEFASTYTYLAAMRIGPLAQKAGVSVRWRPFLLGPIFQSLGWPADSPFNWQDAKGRHMWRDMERQCSDLGLPLVRPDPFPQPNIRAARVGIAIARDEEAAASGALEAYAQAVLHAAFAEGRGIDSSETLSDCLSAAGLDAIYLDRAQEQGIKDGLRTETDTAMAAGVFGAPTFVTAKGELFWGNDRLEQALDWAARE